MITMPHITPGVLGWDIGGVNTKAVLFPSLEARSVPLEIQHDPGALGPTLRRLADDLGADGAPHAITMTAELSQAFRTKREGVGVVLDAVEAAFPGAGLHVYTVGGRFVTPAEARSRPLEVAASNWAATARLVARFVADCILIDIGTTSTDIIPIARGEVMASGRTDPERLATGELVYTGALRTPCEAVAAEVPLEGVPCAVSAEGFALMGDVHLWTGRLAPEDYTVTTPDGRPATREFAGERLARVVCADREMLSEGAISEIADALAEAQARRVGAAISRVRSRQPHLALAVITGLGDFIASDAARRTGLEVVALSDRLGNAARTAPAAAVAWLLAETLSGRDG
jgi:(4-(4-[2-(gamma-L-glutamylamino)ethyl]phenoxymethyl)furan-2-yl)methanamine synthase